MCEAGVCQPVTLAVCQPGVFGIAVDATNVYWTKDVPKMSPTYMWDCAVMKMPVAGGAAVVFNTVIDVRGYDMAVDATTLYLTSQWRDFVNEGEIYKLALAGGAPNKIYSLLDYPRGIVTGPSYVYWGEDAPFPQLVGASLTGGPNPNFYDAQFMHTVGHGVAADATSVYGAVPYTGMVGGAIWKYPAGGGAHVEIVAGEEGINYLAMDATNLYWTKLSIVGGVMQDHQGTVVKMPKAGGAVTILASGLGGPKRIVVDATHVYWNDDVDGVIMKVPIAGGAPTILASGQMGTNGLAVDATSVYWTDSIALTVNKVAK